jgi:hypothetical protein
MKSLSFTKTFLEGRVPELLITEDGPLRDFYLKVKELINTNPYLKNICSWDKDVLYIKPLDTSVRYKYLEGNLIDVELTHPDIEMDSPLYPDGINSKSIDAVIEYIKERVNKDNFFTYLMDNYEEFTKKLDDRGYFIECLLEACEYHDHYKLNVSLVEDKIDVVYDDRLVKKTFYFTDLNMLVTVAQGYFDSWSDTNWERGIYYLSRPITQLTTVYVKD